MLRRDSWRGHAACLSGVCLAALCCAPLLASGVDDLVQSVADAPGSWGDAAKEVVQRIIHFFKNESYGRIALAGGIVLAGIYLWRRPGRRTL